MNNRVLDVAIGYLLLHRCLINWTGLCTHGPEKTQAATEINACENPQACQAAWWKHKLFTPPH